VKIAGVLTKIRNEHFPNTSLRALAIHQTSPCVFSEVGIEVLNIRLAASSDEVPNSLPGLTCP
jgi:hypothetical protein